MTPVTLFFHKELIVIKNNEVFKLTLSALLISIGIVIPMVSPIKILLEPASFTLASHVSIFIAMFISPGIAVAVSLGTAAGFMLAGFPLIIALRALSHVVFAIVGGIIIKKNKKMVEDKVKSQLFSFLIGIIHGASEMAIVTVFYFGGALPEANYTEGFFYSIFLLVGIGTLLHSMIDFSIAQIVWKGLTKRSKKLAKIS